MAASVSCLREWLDSLDDDDLVCVDEARLVSVAHSSVSMVIGFKDLDSLDAIEARSWKWHFDVSECADRAKHLRWSRGRIRKAMRLADFCESEISDVLQEFELL